MSETNTNQPVVIKLRTKFRRQLSEVDIKLKDGREYRSIVVNQDGQLLGRVVGGQTGVDKTPLPFAQKEIVAYRQYWGFLARFGIRPWHQLVP